MSYLRKCVDCGLEALKAADLLLFERDKRAKHSYRNTCKVCGIKKQKHTEAVKGNLKRKYELIRSLKDRPCTDCGIQYPYYVMDFDHLPQYIKSFSMNGQARGYKEETILKEAAKCEVVCSNCHRIRTHQRREYKYADS